MRARIRFAIVVTRHVLAVVEVLAFPPEARGGARQGWRRVLPLSRLSVLLFATIGISRAWRELKAAEE